MTLNDGQMGARFDKNREQKKRTQDGLPGEDEDQLPPPAEMIRADKDNVVGRNDPCPCGSGKKYKKCCVNK